MERARTLRSSRCLFVRRGRMGFPRFRSHQAISNEMRSVYTGISPQSMAGGVGVRVGAVGMRGLGGPPPGGVTGVPRLLWR
jgi:hypothetical protein